MSFVETTKHGGVSAGRATPSVCPCTRARLARARALAKSEVRGTAPCAGRAWQRGRSEFLAQAPRAVDGGCHAVVQALTRDPPGPGRRETVSSRASTTRESAGATLVQAAKGLGRGRIVLESLTSKGGVGEVARSHAASRGHLSRWHGRFRQEELALSPAESGSLDIVRLDGPCAGGIRSNRLHRRPLFRCPSRTSRRSRLLQSCQSTSSGSC